MKVLTEKDKQQICNAWNKLPEDKRNKAEFARTYDVSPRTIGRIINGDERKTGVTKEAKPVKNNKAKPAKVERKEEQLPLDLSDVEGKPDSSLTVVRWFGSKGAITMTLSNGENISVNKQNENYQNVLDALMEENFEEAIRMSSAKKMIEYGFGNVKVTQNCVSFKGRNIDLGIAKFLIERLRSGDEEQVVRLSKFLNNLMENPSYKSVQQLYPFLKHNDIVIDAKGYVECWKVVRKDYKDCHSGTFDNSVGKVVEMDRNQVEDDPNKLCSAGLHVCAKSYIPSFISSGNRVMKIRVHPRDFVSVPTDYKFTKCRICRYEVLADVTDSEEWKK